MNEGERENKSKCLGLSFNDFSQSGAHKKALRDAEIQRMYAEI